MSDNYGHDIMEEELYFRGNYFQLVRSKKISNKQFKFYDYIAHISLIFKEKLLLSPVPIKNMYIEYSLISEMPIFIFWNNI